VGALSTEQVVQEAMTRLPSRVEVMLEMRPCDLDDWIPSWRKAALAGSGVANHALFSSRWSM
jgi:hypothetical protein